MTNPIDFGFKRSGFRVRIRVGAGAGIGDRDGLELRVMFYCSRFRV